MTLQGPPLLLRTLLQTNGRVRSQGGPWLKMNRKQKRIALILLLVAFIILWIQKYGPNIFRGVQIVPYTGFKNDNEPSQNSITPIKHTEHLMVSAFIDHRFSKAIRVISIIRRDKLQDLYCSYCVESFCRTVDAEVIIHSDHFGFSFGATDVLCQGPNTEAATKVALTATVPNLSGELYQFQDVNFLPIRNTVEKNTFKYKFTVCISSLFGAYNNVLQFVQTLEMYKLLGVEHVVIYNTSCGPDLKKLLQKYQEEGFLEIVPWPIDQFLTPSPGWNAREFSGELHYYGQLVTLNECIYRHMYQSRYVLLNDIDEIIMPYQHRNLPSLMQSLQLMDDSVGVFLIQNPIFPYTQFEDTGTFKRPQWEDIPGVNIMEHIYREPDRMFVFNPRKMIINPRKVVQTSVHYTLINLANVYKVPFELCHIVHVRVPLQGSLSKQQLIVDNRVWDFNQTLVQNVDRALRRSGFLK
ncbi:hypothetical protein NFI96_029402 [Prochilodus magdalenae]|nr:hypothetical protein NFI96_029402 [Prochilodus magdalenae]